MLNEQTIKNILVSIASLLISIGCILGLSQTNRNYFKLALFLTGCFSSSIGLLTENSIDNEYEDYQDNKIINRELRLSLPFSTPKIEEKNEKQPLRIKNPSKNWLEEIVIKTNHYRINGQTESGKSTFTNNLIGLIYRTLRNPIIELLDPKYPFSQWQIEPTYKGLEECLNGLERIGYEVEARLKEARKDKMNGFSIREFDPIIFIVDEIDWLIEEYKKEATKYLKIGLKVGRALNIKILYIGQTPLCSELGLRKNNFKNSANFFLGDNILAGIDEVAITKQEKYNLEVEYSMRIDEQQKFLVLIKPIGRKAFLSKLPKPNTYNFQVKKKPQNNTVLVDTNTKIQTLQANIHKQCSDLHNHTEEIKTPKIKKTILCKKCGSSNTKYHSQYKTKKGLKTRNICKECGATFTI